MKLKIKISILLASMMLMFSCIEETVVINTVHEDGSVSRKVTMKSDERIDPEDYRVPVDSTWQTNLTYEPGEKNDTTWILTAEKTFESAAAITEAYHNDKGCNRHMKRSANFSRSFKWFTNVYRYSETIEETFSIDCPMTDYLNEEEMIHLSLPKSIREERENGPDSTRIQVLNDSIDSKMERYVVSAFVIQWTEEFCDLVDSDPELEIDRNEIKSREAEFVQDLYREANLDDFDLDSFIVKELGKDFVNTYGPEIDSAVSNVENMAESFFSTTEYDLGIIMPGKIIATNGYARTDSISDAGIAVLWNVDGVHFLTQPYVMWTESRINNYWVWLVTAVFVLFVIIGLLKRSKKEKD